MVVTGGEETGSEGGCSTPVPNLTHHLHHHQLLLRFNAHTLSSQFTEDTVDESNKMHTHTHTQVQ